ncbi:MAG: DUF4129 domain-containing protein [Candidatus Rokubacteria bacterium]|nr:DUF4129 domain-containing protein [Candidatus Rokubacteria bacterium]
MRTSGRDLGARFGAAAIAGLGLLLALTATLGPPPAPSTAPGATLLIRVPDLVAMVVLGLLAVAVLLLFSLQGRRRRREDEAELARASVRSRRPGAVLASVPVALLLLALVYLTWTRWSPGAGHPLAAPLAAIAGLLELLAQARKPPTSVPAYDHALAALALLLALATFALMVLVVLAEPLVRWWAGRAERAVAPPRDDAPGERLDDAGADPDARAAIIRAYRRFELALAAARVMRPAWQTPAEFMRTALAQAPMPSPPVERLTALFELARFSDRPLGAEARDAACACVAEIRTALATGPPHAR